MGWVWVDPKGLRSSLHLTQADACANAVLNARMRGGARSPTPLERAVEDRLWLSLVRAGWKLEKDK
jgi:hypothetical protein